MMSAIIVDTPAKYADAGDMGMIMLLLLLETTDSEMLE